MLDGGASGSRMYSAMYGYVLRNIARHYVLNDSLGAES
jgi:hypothetical protein